MTEPVQRIRRTVWNGRSFAAGERVIPDEVAVAITYGGSTHAVMMATPQDLEDFAIGFSLTEGLIAAPADIRDLDVIGQQQGIELRMWLRPDLGDALSRRRRLLAGPTGCGLCGIESLAEAVKPARRVTAAFRFPPEAILGAVAALPSAQILNRRAHALHAAGFYVAGEGLLAIREDVGRHNALDKLIGHLARRGCNPASGIIAVTSRISVEMVQKAAAFGASAIAAISAPTALAVRMAEEAGVTLVANTRESTFECFAHAHRIGRTAASGTSRESGRGCGDNSDRAPEPVAL